MALAKRGVKRCRRCGKTFVKPENLSCPRWQKRRFCSVRCATTKIDVSHKEVCRRYKGGLSSAGVAKALKVNPAWVVKIVRAAGLTRSASARQKLAQNSPKAKATRALVRHTPCPVHVKEKLRLQVGPKHPLWLSGVTASGGYLVFTSSPANGAHAGRRLHELLAEWRHGRRLKKGEVVHHRDGDRLNNHPNNLEIMRHSEHARLHAVQSGLGKRKDRQ